MATVEQKPFPVSSIAPPIGTGEFLGLPEFASDRRIATPGSTREGCQEWDLNDPATLFSIAGRAIVEKGMDASIAVGQVFTTALQIPCGVPVRQKPRFRQEKEWGQTSSGEVEDRYRFVGKMGLVAPEEIPTMLHTRSLGRLRVQELEPGAIVPMRAGIEYAVLARCHGMRALPNFLIFGQERQEQQLDWRIEQAG
jgi:hypothetical protein